MCFVTWANSPRQLAKKDVKIMKVLSNSKTLELLSPHARFKYELNKVYKTQILPSESKQFPGYYEVIEFWAEQLGLDGSITFDIKDFLRNSKKLKWFGQGFHSFLPNNEIDQKIYTVDTFYVRFKGYIPKGSEYYTCPLGTVVSSGIVLTGKI